MNESNPFAVIFAVTAILLLITVGFGLVAPSVYPDLVSNPMYKMPTLPTLQTGYARGNFTSSYAFDETHDVVAYYNYVDFNQFIPHKEAVIGRAVPPFPDYVVIQHEATSFSVIPTSEEEPFYYLNGKAIYHQNDNPENLLNRIVYTPTQLSGQEIINNRNGTTSTFIINKDDPNKFGWVDFTPLSGYSTLVDSWNNGNGFTVRIYSDSYTPPSWTEQLVAVLAFVGQLIGFFGQFVVWLFIMGGLLSSVLLGLSPALGGVVMALIGIIFIGSILMFLRGGSNK